MNEILFRIGELPVHTGEALIGFGALALALLLAVVIVVARSGDKLTLRWRDYPKLPKLTVPVRLSGPFDALDWKIEWTSVVAGAVKQQIEGKIAEQLGLKPAAPGASKPNPRDLLKDKLKGIFR